MGGLALHHCVGYTHTHRQIHIHIHTRRYKNLEKNSLKNNIYYFTHEVKLKQNYILFTDRYTIKRPSLTS